MQSSPRFPPFLDKDIPGSRWADSNSSSDDESEPKLTDAEFLGLNKFGDTPTTVLEPTIYDESVLRRYRKNESSRFFNKNYLTEVQKTLRESDRDSIVKWMMCKAPIIEITDDALFLAVRIFDYILGKKEFSRDSLTMHGGSCLLIASKMEDDDNQTICAQIVEVATNLTEAALIEDELVVTKLVGYNAFFITPIMYLRVFLQKLFITDSSINVKKTWILAKIIAFCSLFTDKCSVFSSEEISKECIRLVLVYQKKVETFNQLNFGPISDECHRRILDVLDSVVKDAYKMGIVRQFSDLATELPSLVASNQ